jgi:non-canonical purine NTP pyrophosphatase, rdgB/HAM1 family
MENPSSGILVLASHNRKKLAELDVLVRPLGLRVVSVGDVSSAPEPEETGMTFAENAIIKAEAALLATGMASLADDSGLIVDALSGEPGVRSARYAGEKAGDAANNRLLLRNLRDVPDEARTARFVSVIALSVPGKATVTFMGETTGRILREEKGEGGFGYDPLFLSDDLGVTFAEAGAEEKNMVSHRARGMTKCIAYMRENSFG